MQAATTTGMHHQTFRYLSSATVAAALLLGSPAPADGSSANSDVADGDVADGEASLQADAQARYEQGVQAYRAQRFREAIELFLAADRLVPRAALAFNVARAYEKLQEPARALQHYRDYLRRGPDASNEAEVKSRVQELEATLAERGVQQITVRSKPRGATLFVDGVARGTTPWTGELPLGKHHVQAQHEDYQARRVSVTLDGNEALELELSLPYDQHSEAPGAAPADANSPGAGEQRDLESGRLQPWAWVALGSSGAALATAGVFELLRRDAESDAQSARYQPAYHAHRERMSSHQTTARILLGAGAVLALGGGMLALIDGAEGEAERSPVALG